MTLIGLTVLALVICGLMAFYKWAEKEGERQQMTEEQIQEARKRAAFIRATTPRKPY